MDTTTHPTGAAHINRETLAALVDKAGPGRVRTLAQLFVEKNGSWHLDVGLLLYPARLTQVTNQVTFRFADAPIRHLPLSMDDAKVWAAAWTIVKAQENGLDVDGHLASLATWIDTPDVAPDTRAQAEVDFAPILADFPKSLLDATGRPDIRLTLTGFPTQLRLNGTTITLPAWDSCEDVALPIGTFEQLVLRTRWADALLMRWMKSPSGKAWVAAQS